MRIVPYIGLSSYLLDIKSLKGGLTFNEVGIQMVAVENIIIFHMEIRIQRPHQHGKTKKKLHRRLEFMHTHSHTVSLIGEVELVDLRGVFVRIILHIN